MPGDKRNLLSAAIAAVRDCADTMEAQAGDLLQALPTVPMEEGLRPQTLQISAQLKEASSRVTFELALLQAEVSEGKAAVATAIERLSGMDATMMRVLAALPDAVDQLEKAAERDEAHEPAFVLVIEATSVMLQGLSRAKAATEALGAAGPSAASL
jgi:hypothetical protein